MDQLSPKTQLWYAGKKFGCVSLPDWQDIYRSDIFGPNTLGTMIANPRTKSIITTYGPGQGKEIRLRELATKSNPGKTIRLQMDLAHFPNPRYRTTIPVL